VTTTVIDLAKAWRDQDPDDETRAELDILIADAETGNEDSLAELRDRFESRLTFGTAGLRGPIEAGPNGMNRVLVAQAAAGFAAYLLEREAEPSVVIGYDGRKNSHVFATDTAELMAGAGVRAILLPRLLPTPVLAFAVRHFDVSAGVMVTASHNPPNDNGYKVYLGGADQGAQIVSPADAHIEEQIRRVADTSSALELPRSTDYETADRMRSSTSTCGAPSSIGAAPTSP
jgi:phosphomannomutase